MKRNVFDCDQIHFYLIWLQRFFSYRACHYFRKKVALKIIDVYAITKHVHLEMQKV